MQDAIREMMKVRYLSYVSDEWSWRGTGVGRDLGVIRLVCVYTDRAGNCIAKAIALMLNVRFPPPCITPQLLATKNPRLLVSELSVYNHLQ